MVVSTVLRLEFILATCSYLGCSKPRPKREYAKTFKLLDYQWLHLQRVSCMWPSDHLYVCSGVRCMRPGWQCKVRVVYDMKVVELRSSASL